MPSGGSSSSRSSRAAGTCRTVLGVDQVLRVKRLNLADGEPFAVVTVWCPAELGAEPVAGATSSSGRSTSCSAIALRGATQTIGADAAEPEDAALLARAGRLARCCAASG